MSAAFRIGVYGGAFDPPHLAHETLARSAVEQYALDLLIILPTGLAWHKSRSLTAAAHRVAMAELAFADVPRTRVDARETLRQGASYTIDSLKEIQSENPHAEFFLLMGQDQLRFLPQWHSYQEILQIATLLVAMRADSVPAISPKAPQNTAKIAFSTIPMPASAISATDIRELIRLQGSEFPELVHLVKPSVAGYIAQHRLYLSS